MKFFLKYLKNSIIKIYYHGKRRFCPVCGRYSRQFRRYGSMRRQDALCIHCGALERHRLAWLFMTKRTNLLDDNPKKMLHAAPEACFESILRQKLGNDYITADLFNPKAMVKIDITETKFPDRFFDVIYCSHVLEHVQDDRKAMCEFFRILKPDGWAILMVPVKADKTYEDPSVKSPEDRLRVFGQKDHVRNYGPDFIDRLKDAGFIVEIIKISDLAANDEALLMGLTPASGDIFYCRKIHEKK